MNRTERRKGLSRVALAYVFLMVDVTVNTLNVLPGWVGYLLLLSAISLLEPELRDLPLLRPFCLILAAAEAVDWTAALLTGQDLLQQILPVRAVWTCLAMYVTFQLLTDLAGLAERDGVSARGLLICRNLDVLIRAAVFLPLPWENWSVVVWLAGIGIAVCLVIMLRLFALCT